MNVHNLRLREATLVDASVLAAISLEVWFGTYIRKGVTPFFAEYALSEFSAEKFRLLLQDPNEYFIVSCNAEGIDGFVRVRSPSQAPVAQCSDFEICTLYVQPRHHGKGIGKALLREAIGYAQHLGSPSVWLTVNTENASAIAFYYSQGFERVGETFFRIVDQAYPNEVLRYSFA